MNEYDCWFQSGRTLPTDINGEVLSRVYLEAAGSIAENAAREYIRLLQKQFDIAAVRVSDADSPCVTISVSPEASAPAEGFCITVQPEGVQITGNGECGALYGVYRFAALLSLGRIHNGDVIREAPACPLRIINHWDRMDGTIVRGYAGNSLFYKNNRFDYDAERVEDYARLLASIGINRLSINNVNVEGNAKRLITGEFLPDVATLAAIFRPYGIRLLLCIDFAAPFTIGGLETADPLDAAVAAWWRDAADAVYRQVPDLAGFLVKADAEGEPGPFQYGRNHADGANMLAAALAPHGGDVIWRCFVYDCAQDWRDTAADRARSAYDVFMPHDGAFADNVILQIKHGPYDFQVREPVSPLFGALKKTRHLMELQITQEYTGHQIDLCYLPTMWEWVMNFDTKHGENATIKQMLGVRGTRIEGLAAVGNVGLDRNWTGHTLAQANLYAYGRLAWNPHLGAKEIAEQLAALSFGNNGSAATVSSLLLSSYNTYEKYNAPFGVCFMVTPGLHYGPNIEGYEFSRWGTYHRADRQAIGIDRTPSGTGYTAQYSPANAALFADLASCPENLLLFFHRLRYDYRMKNGETLLQNIYDTHFDGYAEVQAMLDSWVKLRGEISGDVYESVLERLRRQLDNAREWRDQVNTYFYRHTGIGDKKGRRIYT